MIPIVKMDTWLRYAVSYEMNTRRTYHRSSVSVSCGGFTLLELIVAATILSVLTLMALPMARLTIQREQEKQLRRALWEMRDAIDRYKEQADRATFQTKVDSYGYSTPDLQSLCKGNRGAGWQ